MANIQLKKAVTAKKQVTYEKKPALYAKECDGCGRVFQMREFCNDHDLAELRGTFDMSSYEHGNMFHATACTFKCADDIMNGKWKEMKEYKEFKKAGAKLGRCELKITPYIKEESELIAEWECK
jgi:hypothetical protein